MKSSDPRKVLVWLQTRPSLDQLRQAFPDQWRDMEQELATAVAERNPSRLHLLLNPGLADSGRASKPSLNHREKQHLVHAAVRQRMAALAIERYSLAITTGKTSGKVRFNLFNGLLAQRLLFKRGFERKPVALFWFRLLWPLVWQKRFLMPLVEKKGIYCFYSQTLISRLAALIGSRASLEIGAGDGTLAGFLAAQGVKINASDDYSWQDHIDYPESVRRMDAVAALRHFAPQVVICSWPPARNSFEREVFRTASVELYIVILSQHQFASGNWGDYQAQRNFKLEPRPDLSRLLLPPELGCQVMLFTRQSTAVASDAGLAPGP